MQWLKYSLFHKNRSVIRNKRRICCFVGWNHCCHSLWCKVCSNLMKTQCINSLSLYIFFIVKSHFQHLRFNCMCNLLHKSETREGSLCPVGWIHCCHSLWCKVCSDTYCDLIACAICGTKSGQYHSHRLTSSFPRTSERISL